MGSPPGLALKCTWEVLPDTHGSDHYPIFISMPPTSGDTDQDGDPSHWVFSRADWDQFAELCMDKITGDILHDQDPLTSFVTHVIDAAKDSIPRATTCSPPKVQPLVWWRMPGNAEDQVGLGQKSPQRRGGGGGGGGGGGARVETLISSRQTQAQARRLFTQKKSHGPGMCHNWTPTPQSSMCGTEWGKYPVKMSAHPSNISMGRMVLPSLTPRISLMRKQQHSQTTPPLPTTVPDSRPSRLKMRELESTSPMITLKSTTSPSDWEISGALSWRPNPVPLGLTGSKTTCWNTSLRTH